MKYRGAWGKKSNMEQILTLTFILLHKIKQHGILATIPPFPTTVLHENSESFTSVLRKFVFSGHGSNIFHQIKL